jgi:carboxylesterase
MTAELESEDSTQHSALSTQHSVGVLLLHGLTSSLATVDGLLPHLEARGLPYALPTLRGHGTRPEDLRGVTWHGWYEDAERALDDLLTRCARVVVMGLSMGGVVALHLGVQRPERLAGIVTVAAALRLNIPAGFLLPLLGRSGRLTTVNPANAFEDAALAAGSTNYPSAPLSAIYSLVQFGKVVERELPQMRVPLLALYTPRDRVVLPESAQIIYAGVGTPPEEKAIRAFDRSGHEMLLDRQREEAFAAIMAFIEGRDKP